MLVALIGRQWATLADEEGRRRLDNPDDWVRFEVSTALERGVRVIPVLVDGARPPGPQQLPSELQKLARLNVVELSYGRYEYDANQLLDLIERVLAAASGSSTAHQSPATVNVEGPAVPAQKGPKTVRNDPGRFDRLIADAERTAWSMTDESEKASTFGNIARALAATDPGRAARLIAEAERIARSVSYDGLKIRALTGAAKALTATDPDRAARLIIDAERIAHSIRYDESWKKVA